MTAIDREYLAKDMPRDSYLDYLTWLCLEFFEESPDVGAVLRHPFFLTFYEWDDFVRSCIVTEKAIETLIEPLDRGIE